MNINWSKVTAVVTLLILMVGFFVDFQIAKGAIKTNTRQISVTARLLCSHAIDKQWKDAKLICNDIK